MDPKLTKWLRWLDVIKAEIQDLVIAKRTFHEVQQLIRDNSVLQQPSSFYDFIASTYVSHVLIGLHRQLKCGDQSISLAGLFEGREPSMALKRFITQVVKLRVLPAVLVCLASCGGGGDGPSGTTWVETDVKVADIDCG
jgi:hypothetical protein